MTDVKHVLQIRQSAEEFGGHWIQLIRRYLDAIENDTPVPSTTHASVTWDPKLFSLLLDYVDRHGLPPYYPTQLPNDTEESSYEGNGDANDQRDIDSHASPVEPTNTNNLPRGMPDTLVLDDSSPFSYDSEGRFTVKLYVFTTQVTSGKKIIASIGQEGGVRAHTGHDNPNDDGYGKVGDRDDRKFSSWIEIKAATPYCPPTTSSDWGIKKPGTNRDLTSRHIGQLDKDKFWHQMEISLSYSSRYPMKWVSVLEGTVPRRSIWKSSGKDNGLEWALNFIAQPGEKSWTIPLDRSGPRCLKGDSYLKGWIDTIVEKIIGKSLPIEGANSASAAYYIFIGQLQGNKNWKINNYNQQQVADSIRMTLQLIDSQGTTQSIELAMNKIDVITLY